MTLRLPLPDTARVITVTNKIGSPDDRSSFVRGPAARADRGLSRGGAGLCRGEARAARQARGGLRDGRGTGRDAWPVGPAPHPLLARAVQPSAFARSCRTARSRLRRRGQWLRSGSPSRLAEKVQIVVGQYWWPWANSSPPSRPGNPPSSRFRHERLRLARGARRARRPVRVLSGQGDAGASRPIVTALDLSGTKRLADIGGGYGGLLAALLGAHPRLEAVLFDRPHMIEAARPFLETLGIARRVKFVAGDVLAAIPVRPISIC